MDIKYTVKTVSGGTLVEELKDIPNPAGSELLRTHSNMMRKVLSGRITIEDPQRFEMPVINGSQVLEVNFESRFPVLLHKAIVGALGYVNDVD